METTVFVLHRLYCTVLDCSLLYIRECMFCTVPSCAVPCCLGVLMSCCVTNVVQHTILYCLVLSCMSCNMVLWYSPVILTCKFVLPVILSSIVLYGPGEKSCKG